MEQAERTTTLPRHLRVVDAARMASEQGKVLRYRPDHQPRTCAFCHGPLVNGICADCTPPAA